MLAEGAHEASHQESLVCSQRSGRAIRFSHHYEDFVPATGMPLAHIPKQVRPPPVDATPAPSLSSSSSADPQEEETAPEIIWATKPDSFGLYREYPSKPTHLPESTITLAHLTEFPSTVLPDSSRVSPAGPPMLPEPYEGSADWDRHNLSTFSFKKEVKRLDLYMADKANNPFREESGWRTSTVHIRLPAEKVKQSEADALLLTIEMYHCPIMDIISSVLRDELSAAFHLTPFKQYWQPTPESQPERVYSEAYCSDAMLEMHRDV
ncbi:hypothetical protein CERSUDRAFT_90056 [Gelatoporia subvermispora B]|uniref:Uncharacterized protein n=1 Tax=Ceriporiopsis subvermispora (strain B) TaxID=914234 RepID=M2RSS7_CERS8|nr:hypothetical protein CERSUDRAFT_90056 [Gelatoporia subvermispora B]